MKAVVVLLSSVLAFLPATLVKAHPVEATVLAKGSASWDGEGFQYPSGKPELTVQKIAIKAGTEPLQLAMHCHTIPIAAYVLSGSVRVIKESGKETLFKAGDALIEVVNSWHKGVFTEDAELIVFYAGAEGVPLSIKKETEAGAKSGCHH